MNIFEIFSSDEQKENTRKRIEIILETGTFYDVLSAYVHGKIDLDNLDDFKLSDKQIEKDPKLINFNKKRQEKEKK